MIIKRMYCTYGQLMEDEKTSSMLMEALKKTMSEDSAKHIMNEDANIFVFNTDMGSGIPGTAYQEIRQGLEHLDKSAPYDNGLSLADVTQVVAFPNEEGNAVTQFMINRIYDLQEIIVQVVAFECDDKNEMHFIEPWDVGQISF